MLRIGGKPARTYVIGDTLFATSLRVAELASHWTASDRTLGPARMSFTSVMPYQLMMPATFGTALSEAENPPPAQTFVNPALAGIMPAARARCPPADSPLTTMRLGSTP